MAQIRYTAFFGDTRLVVENGAPDDTSSGAKRARVGKTSPPGDGHVYESAVAGRTRTRSGCTGVVLMHLDGNYPIGDADPLIHSSATPETPRSRDTYESA